MLFVIAKLNSIILVVIFIYFSLHAKKGLSLQIFLNYTHPSSPYNYLTKAKILHSKQSKHSSVIQHRTISLLIYIITYYFLHKTWYFNL